MVVRARQSEAAACDLGQRGLLVLDSSNVKQLDHVFSKKQNVTFYIDFGRITEDEVTQKAVLWSVVALYKGFVFFHVAAWVDTFCKSPNANLQGTLPRTGKSRAKI